MYPKEMTDPMVKELTTLGIKELKSKSDVEKALRNKGTTLVVINSVCGCSAGSARPAVGIALEHTKKPKHLYTAFAGVDKEATEAVRSHIKEYPPSSPSIALFKDGKLIFFLQRSDIQGRHPQEIAKDLTEAFDEMC